jgi:hypothetical protein
LLTYRFTPFSHIIAIDRSPKRVRRLSFPRTVFAVDPMSIDIRVHHSSPTNGPDLKLRDHDRGKLVGGNPV